MIKMKKMRSLFDEDEVREYSREGRVIGTANRYGLILYKYGTRPVRLSRAQGFKYWRKYFPGRIWTGLPEALQEALEEPCMTRGVYFTREGEAVAYEG